MLWIRNKERQKPDRITAKLPDQILNWLASSAVFFMDFNIFSIFLAFCGIQHTIHLMNKFSDFVDEGEI